MCLALSLSLSPQILSLSEHRDLSGASRKYLASVLRGVKSPSLLRFLRTAKHLGHVPFVVLLQVQSSFDYINTLNIYVVTFKTVFFHLFFGTAIEPGCVRYNYKDCSHSDSMA